MIILASSSPRREELLRMLGLEFRIVWPEIREEIGDAGSVEEIVINIARQKAKAIEKKISEEKLDISDGKDDIIIAADTVVVYRTHILGKPKGDNEAKKMLKMLSGKWHRVYTGVCLIFKSKDKTKEQEEEITFYEVTKVKFRKLTDEEIEYYISTKEHIDKAGAYGIQGLGSVLVEKIFGDYTNVVGLPIPKLWKILYVRGIVARNAIEKWTEREVTYSGT